jgi:hypothetical protein
MILFVGFEIFFNSVLSLICSTTTVKPHLKRSKLTLLCASIQKYTTSVLHQELQNSLNIDFLGKYVYIKQNIQKFYVLSILDS